MRHLLAALVLVAPVLLAGCSKEEDPHKLVAEANALLVKGGIEDSKTRALAEQKYDRAIRIICGPDNLQCTRSGSGSAPGTDDHSLAHAHFGLAFARSFDLVERIRQLYESGTIMRPEEFVTVGDEEIDVGEEEENAEEANTDRCEQQVNLPQLVPLLKTIVDTSLLPIVADLQSVTAYPEFSIEYEKAFLDFGFLNPDLPADEQLGVEFGQEGGVNAKFTVAEVYAALAVFRVITVGAEAVFSFQDLTQAAIVFLPKIDFSAGVRPYALARVLNSDPCMANPLTNAAWGVLTEAGRGTFADIEEQLRKLFEEQQLGFTHIEEKQDGARLIDYAGKEWASNLLKRIKTGNSTDDSNLQTIGRAITALLSPQEVAGAFGQLLASISNGDTFDLVAFVEANEDLHDLITVQKEINLDQMGIPAISFKRFFENPISDLKSIFPLTYAESEPVTQNLKEAGFLQMLDQDKPVGQQDLTWLWKDVNGDGHFNQKGDFIVQTEREVFFDRNNSEDPSKQKEEDLVKASGILGTFWDADFNGSPDASYEGLIPGASGTAVTYATGKLWASAASAATEDLSYRDYFSGKLLKSNGCLDYVPVKPTDTVTDGRATCEVEIGQVLGHVWPSIYPEPFEAVSATDSRRRDPANGVVDRMYMFYPNPSVNGAFQIKGEQGYRPFANEDLNRFVSGMLGINSTVSKLTSDKK